MSAAQAQEAVVDTLSAALGNVDGHGAFSLVSNSGGYGEAEGRSDIINDLNDEWVDIFNNGASTVQTPCV